MWNGKKITALKSNIKLVLQIYSLSPIMWVTQFLNLALDRGKQLSDTLT
jgi:ABC-type arginine transport system ATPase subunit